MKKILYTTLLSILLCSTSYGYTYQSTSLEQGLNFVPRKSAQLKVANDNIITFSEYPVNTLIASQYAERGIIFSGDSPFIASDDAKNRSSDFGLCCIKSQDV